MRSCALVLIALTITACSQSDKERAREQADRAQEEARQAAEKMRVEAKEALRQAEVDARKANRELTDHLNNARDKTRRALDLTDTDGHR